MATMHFKLWLAESKFTFEDLTRMAKKAKLDVLKYDKKELLDGINTEKEHRDTSKKLDVIGKDDSKILKIAAAHLEEDPNYYKKLKKAKL